MATFILTWNPDLWPMGEAFVDEAISTTAAGDEMLGNWSTGLRRQGIGPNDRVFVWRQRRDRGITASGIVKSDIYPDLHWRDQTTDGTYVDVAWDTWLPAGEQLPVERLKDEVPQVSWNSIRGGGVLVDGAAAVAVEELWHAHLDGLGKAWFAGADEVPPAEHREGTTRQVTVNRYERDPAVRRACIAHHGTRCGVCDFDFGERYGKLGKGYIHVHHLDPLSKTGERQVDPVKHLRPVCPNCHAMLHRKNPPLSIAQLKLRLRSSRGSES